MSNPDYTRALSQADARFTHLKSTNKVMIAHAVRHLREHNDPAKAWAALTLNMTKEAQITPTNQGAYLAIESLAATYIEQAQNQESSEKSGPSREHPVSGPTSSPEDSKPRRVMARSKIINTIAFLFCAFSAGPITVINALTGQVAAAMWSGAFTILVLYMLVVVRQNLSRDQH